MTYRGKKLPVDEALRIIHKSDRLPDEAKAQIELVLWFGNYKEQVRVLQSYYDVYPEIVVAGIRS